MVHKAKISLLSSERRTTVRSASLFPLRNTIWGTIVLILFLSSTVPSASPAGELQETLQLGIHIGYSGTYVDPAVSPNIFDGGAVGAHVVFGINDVVAVAWDAAFDWHRSYREYNYKEYENEDGEVSMEWLPGAKIRRYFVSTTALSVLYAIDISRVVPYLVAGVSGARVDRDVNDVHDAGYALGLRVGGGFDYYFRRFTVGVGITSDKYYLGNTDHDLRLVFLLRISYLIHR